LSSVGLQAVPAAAFRAVAIAVALTAVIGHAVGYAQGETEDVLLLRVGGAAEGGETARFDSALAEWRAAGRFSLSALERKGVLHLASRGSTPAHTEIVNRLLALGLDPNAPTGLPRYPLHLAAAAGNLATVEALLRHDARIGVADEDGQSVLHAAVEGGGTGAEAIVRRLLALRADLEARNIWGQTPLHWAAWHDASLIPILVDAGASLEATDRTGRTPLLTAHGDGIAALLTAGAKASAADARGNTAVHWAATTGAAAVRRLVEAGLAPDVANSAGLTPLHFAVVEGGGTAPAVIELLIGRGANPNATTTADYAYLSPWLNPRANQPQLVAAGATPLAIAQARHRDTKWSSGGYPAIIEALERHGAKAAGTGLAAGDTPALTAYGALSIPFALAGIALFAVGLLHADAHMTGWRRIAGRHAAPAALDGKAFRRQDADVGTVGFVRTRNLMRAAVLDEGLYLAMPAIARPGHRSLLVPWTELSIANDTQILGRPVVKLSVGSPVIGSITLRGGVAADARERVRQRPT
jgi:ankyrin repeat protein